MRRLYSFAVPPTLAFYFDVPLEEAMRRISVGRPELKHYEAGLDLGLSNDPYESFRRFQSLIREVAASGGDIGQFVPEAVRTAIIAAFQH